VRHPQQRSRRSARSVARTSGLEAGEAGAILIQPGAGRQYGVKLAYSVSRFPKIRVRRAEQIFLVVMSLPLILWVLVDFVHWARG
jgi:hypothetical protein